MGYFIAIDGCDAAGKSTAMSHVKDFFMEHKGMQESDIILTREPGGTPLGESLRELLLTPVKNPKHDLDIKSELLMMYASRNQLINEVIKPALDEGKLVITDRWESSTFAYQTIRGAKEDDVMKLSDMVCDVKPDMLMLLDVRPEVTLERIAKKRNNVMDRTESSDVEFFKEVREAYLRYADKVDNVLKIDASVELDEMLENIDKSLKKEFLKEKKPKKSRGFGMSP